MDESDDELFINEVSPNSPQYKCAKDHTLVLYYYEPYDYPRNACCS